jgi:hypothetical protein
METTAMQGLSRRAAGGRIVALCASAASVAWGLGVAPARAATLDAADERAIGGAVRDQLAALAADDAPRAYGHAAPGIRAVFPDADAFLAMVKRGYAAIVRPRSVVFFRPEALEDGAADLRVQVVDAEGADWIAVYRLERQPDRAWKIAGCALAPSRGRIA